MADDAPAQSLQVSPELEAEFEAALQYHLTDEDLERAKLLLGIETASRARELYSVATPDAIRNWALGVGDDNPLYTDEDYGPTTRLGNPDRPRHHGGPRQDADARRPDPHRDQAADEEPLPRRARVRVGRHLGLVPAAAAGRPRLLVLGRRVARGQEVGVRGPIGGAGAARRRAQPVWRGAGCVPHPGGAHRAQGGAFRAGSTRRSSPRTTPTTTTSASTRSTSRSSRVARRSATGTTSTSATRSRRW